MDVANLSHANFLEINQTNAKSDEYMTFMHATMIGAWHGEGGVQQGCPSQEGGARLMQFESPRWRPKQPKFEPTSKSTSSTHQKRRLGRIKSPFWTFFIWMEREFYRDSNGANPTSEFHLS